MPGVVQREPHVGRDVGGLAPSERDGPCHELPDMGRVVEALPRLLIGDLDRVEEHEGHQVPGRRGAVDRPVVAVLQQHRDEPAVVQMGVGHHHRVEGIEGKELGRIEVGRPVRTGIDPAVDQHLGVLGGEQVGGAPDLPVPAQGGVPGPQFLLEPVPGDPDTDLLQERAPAVELVAEVDPDLLHGLGRDRAGPLDGRDPSDLPFELIEDRALAPDRGAGVGGLDRHLAGLRLEEQRRDLGLRWDQLADHHLGLLGVPKGRRVRADQDPPAQPLCDLAEIVPPERNWSSCFV